jgi:hypothetical protein
MIDAPDDILTELRDELRSVAPSAAFAAAVRARVANETRAWRPHLTFWTLGVGSLAAAAVTVAVVGSVLWRSSSPAPVSDVPAVRTASAAESGPMTAARAPAVPAKPAAAPAVRRQLPAKAARPKAVSEGPGIEVITNQREMIERVWAAARRRGEVSELTRAESPLSEPLLTALIVAPLDVDPIVVEPQPRPDSLPASAPVIRKLVTLDTLRSER